MTVIDDERFYAVVRDDTAALAEIVTGGADGDEADGDRASRLGHPVPTCPDWNFKQLATHVSRGHRWAAEIVGTRSAEAIPMREVPDGRFPDDPALQADWVSRGASLVVGAVQEAGTAPVWTLKGIGPASFWARRRAHEVAVHLADARLAIGDDLAAATAGSSYRAPDMAADGVDEWLGLIAAGNRMGPLRSGPGDNPSDGPTLHFHATDEGLDGAGEWLVRQDASGITVEPGHAKADVAVRGPAAALLLVLLRRVPQEHVEVLGDRALFESWLENSAF
jgi:uncharacterized protein (TIGR03083 family)